MTRAFIITGYLALAATLGIVALRPAQPTTPVHLLARQAAGVEGTPVVAILLHPRDCADRVEALRAWNRIHRSGRARVVGLVAEGTGVSGELERIGRGAGLEFPLRYVEPRDFRQVLSSLNHRSTPLALLLDGGGQLRMAIPLEAGAPRAAVDLAAHHLSTLEIRPDDR
ncbi:MAG TPA: hypothetical protein VFR81_30390 [Longimicrobium sp.]|nr:hypothetical protein [Longimicrobium sp.]